jgi:hypothetical protein
MDMDDPLGACGRTTDTCTTGTTGATAGATTGTTNTTGTTTGTTGNTGTCTPGDTPTKGDGRNKEKVCVRFKHNDDDKAYRWVSEENKHYGNKIVKDKFCKHKNNRGEHKDPTITATPTRTTIRRSIRAFCR